MDMLKIKLIITLARNQLEFSLTELVGVMTPNNQHVLVEWNKPEGEETCYRVSLFSLG